MKTQNLLTPEETAGHLCVTVTTLAKWRCIGTPMIPFIKIGRCIRYDQADLDAYLAKHTHNKQVG